MKEEDDCCWVEELDAGCWVEEDGCWVKEEDDCCWVEEDGCMENIPETKRKMCMIGIIVGSNNCSPFKLQAISFDYATLVPISIRKSPLAALKNKT